MVSCWASQVPQPLKNSLANAGGGSHPCVRKILWSRKWQPIPVFLLGESHEQRSLVGYSPQSLKGSDTIERLIFHFHIYIYMHIYLYIHLSIYSLNINWWPVTFLWAKDSLVVQWSLHWVLKYAITHPQNNQDITILLKLFTYINHHMLG